MVEPLWDVSNRGGGTECVITILLRQLESPVKATGYAVLPIVEKMQTLRNRYGITTYVALKLSAEER